MLRFAQARVSHVLYYEAGVAARQRSLRSFSFNGRCAPWFQRSFQLLVSVGDCVPWFQRSLTAASSIALIRYRLVLYISLTAAGSIALIRYW